MLFCDLLLRERALAAPELDEWDEAEQAWKKLQGSAKTEQPSQDHQ
jgi:hypothetical protein